MKTWPTSPLSNHCVPSDEDTLRSFWGTSEHHNVTDQSTCWKSTLKEPEGLPQLMLDILAAAQVQCGCNGVYLYFVSVYLSIFIWDSINTTYRRVETLHNSKVAPAHKHSNLLVPRLTSLEPQGADEITRLVDQNSTTVNIQMAGKLIFIPWWNLNHVKIPPVVWLICRFSVFWLRHSPCWL